MKQQIIFDHFLGCASSLPPGFTYSIAQYFLISDGYIPQSVNIADCICEERGRHSTLPLLSVDFSQSLVLWDLPFFGILSSSICIHTIHRVYWMDGPFDSIKFPFHAVFGVPPPILAISGNILLRFLYSPVFNIFRSLDITPVKVLFFSVGAGIGSITSYSLKYCKYIRIFSITQIDQLLVQEFQYTWGLSWYIILLVPCCCNYRYHYKEVILLELIFLCPNHPQ